MLADLGQRDLQLLQHGQQHLDRAELARQALDRGGDLAGVQRVVDPPVAGQVSLSWGGSRSAGSQVISAVCTPGSRAAASTNRVVVSSR